MNKFHAFLFLFFSFSGFLFSSGIVLENEIQLGEHCYKQGSRISLIIDSHRKDIETSGRVFYFPQNQSVLIECGKVTCIFAENRLTELTLPTQERINDFDYSQGQLFAATDSGLYIGNQKKIQNMSVLAIVVYNGSIYISTPGKIYLSPDSKNLNFNELSKHKIFGPLLITRFQIENNMLTAVDDQNKLYRIIGGVISPTGGKAGEEKRDSLPKTVSAEAGKPVPEDVLPLPTYEENKERINLLNFLNGMNLKKEQYQKLYEIALKAKKTREDFEVQIREKKIKAAKILGEMYIKLMKGYKLDPDFLASVSTIGGAVDPVKHRLHGALCDLEEEVLSIFTPIEKQLVRDFVPCVVPPMGLSDPIRIGQAGYSLKDKKLLDDVRKLSEIEFFKRKESLISGILLEAQNEFGLIGEETTNMLREKIAKVLDSSRNLSQIDYEIQREDLAVQVNKENLEAFLKNKREENLRKVQRISGKIDFLFLSEFSMEIYKFKIAQLEKAEI